MKLKTAASTLASLLLLGSIGTADQPVPAEIAPAAPAPAEAVVAEDAKPACAACAEEEEEEEAEAPACNFLNSLIFGDCFTEKTGISIKGHLVQSFTFNPADPVDNFNGPVTFNDRANEYQMNQLYLILQRAVDTKGDKIDVGGRVDLLYGTDAVFTQAFGLDEDFITDSRFYRLAMPQLYGELFVPVGDGLSIKAGHFYTIIGYEVVTTPDNFFSTVPYTFQYGEPFTHTGIIASQTIGQFTIHNSINRGWDNWNDNNNGLSYMGGVSWTSCDEKTSLLVTYITGPEQDEPNRPFQGVIVPPGEDANRWMYSAVLQRQVTDDLKYVIQHDHGYQTAGAVDNFGNAASAEWYGVNQYLLYTVNDKLGIGLRGEWFRDDDGARVIRARSFSALSPDGSAFPPGAAGNYYAVSLAANYALTDCVTLRPEARWDWQ
ncbi:MAG: porin, partial [Planctomycetia bacterium]